MRLKKTDPNYDALKLKRDAEKLKRKSDFFYGKSSDLLRQVESVCVHNETTPKYEYEPGSYYDREIFINKVVCKVCGKVLKEERSVGGYG